MSALVTRHLLRNTSIADLLRRSLTLAPRLWLLLFPLFLAFLGLLAAIVKLDLIPLDTNRAGQLSQSGRELSASLVYAVLLGSASFFAPIVSGLIAVATIRGALAERMTFSLIAAGASRAFGSAVVSGVLVATLASVGYALCWFPGLFVLAYLMAAPAAATVERLGPLESLIRSASLAKGSVVRHAGALFLLWTFIGILARFADMLSPAAWQGSGTGQLALYAVATALVASFACVWQAALFAIAYNDARLGAEGLEIDALAVLLRGGAQIGLDTGAEALSESGLALRQKSRRVIVIVVAAVFGLGMLSIFGYPLLQEKLEQRRREAQFELDKERYAREFALEQERRAAEPVPERTSPPKRRTSEPALPPPPPARTTEEVIASLKGDDAERRKALASDIPQLGEALWGLKIAQLFRKFAKTDRSKYELLLLPEVATQLQLRGCGNAATEARLKGELGSSELAKTCPEKKEPRAISSKAAEKMPVWATALVILIELAAKDFDQQKSPLHKAVVDALKKERRE
jgi:hypothetical protein